MTTFVPFGWSNGRSVLLQTASSSSIVQEQPVHAEESRLGGVRAATLPPSRPDRLDLADLAAAHGDEDSGRCSAR